MTEEHIFIHYMTGEEIMSFAFNGTSSYLCQCGNTEDKIQKKGMSIGILLSEICF